MIDLQEITRVITAEDVGKFCVSVDDAKRLLDQNRVPPAANSDTARQMARAANEWVAARDIIEIFLRELRPDIGYDATANETVDRWAAALIARLARHDPPILLQMEEREP